MANEILQKSRTRITAQAGGTALAADKNPGEAGYTGGAATAIDNTYDGGSENGKGADYLQLELDVTSAPGTAGTSSIWYRGSEDNSNWTKWKYSHTVGDSIATAADRYDGGMFLLSYQYTELKVMADDQVFTATLYATPKLQEVQ